MGSDRIAIASHRIASHRRSGAERSGSSKTAFIAALRRGPVERSEKDPDVPGGRRGMARVGVTNHYVTSDGTAGP
jgi:hypothetical protein